MLFEELLGRRHEIRKTICDLGQQRLLAQKIRSWKDSRMGWLQDSSLSFIWILVLRLEHRI